MLLAHRKQSYEQSINYSYHTHPSYSRMILYSDVQSIVYHHLKNRNFFFIVCFSFCQRCNTRDVHIVEFINRKIILISSIERARERRRVVAVLQSDVVQQLTSRRMAPTIIDCSLQLLAHALAINVVPGSCIRVF